MPPSASATLLAPEPTAPAVASRGRVLIVDDDPGILEACSQALSYSGFTVETAGDGDRAMLIIEGGEHDVVVCDIAMPGRDGFHLLRAVRERDLELQVVMMTGSPEIETAVRALEYGAMHYLIKPFSMTELDRAVARATTLCRIARLRRKALTDLGLIDIQAGDLAGLEAGFERALKALWIAYQPIVRSADGELFGYEALVRADEPTLPHPGALFHAAERLGRLLDLGRAIRASAAATILSRPGDTAFFVNLHARELDDELLYLPDSPLTRVAQRVVLEITERTSVEKINDLGSRVAALRRLGFRIAVDDLGAGYAGLTSLIQLEPEVVKVDMTLIRNIHKEPLKQRLVGSVTELCQGMGVMVVAEGIECAEERIAVVELGCHLLQGFLIGRPLRSLPPL